MSNSGNIQEKFTFVIIGGGIAGVSCVEQILEFDPDANILLISSSSVVKQATNVTRLSKTIQDFLIIEVPLKSFKNIEKNVRVIQDTVVFMNEKNNTITTKNGLTFEYEKLCICTGAKPNVLFFNVDSDRIIGIRDTESVNDLISKISNCRRVLLIGNGGIATEFVYEAKNVEIFWAIKDKSISSPYFDNEIAQFFINAKLNKNTEEINQDEEPAPSKRVKYKLDTSQLDEAEKNKNISQDNERGSALGPDWHSNLELKGLNQFKQVKILYETECSKVWTNKPILAENDDKEWPLYCQMNNEANQIFGVDLIISATGIIPVCDWFTGKKDPDKGIYVNKNMMTSIPNVYAAGDVVFPAWEWAKHWFQMRLWTQARQMGLYTGKCMLFSHRTPDEEIDQDFCFELFSHVTRFFGFKVVLLGLYNSQKQSCNMSYIRCSEKKEYIKCVADNWKMQGAIIIGDTGLEETFENMILNQIDLSPFGEDLLTNIVDLEDYFD